VATVTANLDKKHRQEYDKQFNALDVNKDELVDWKDAQQFIKQIVPSKNDTETEEIAKKLVENVSGSIDKPIVKEDWNNANVAKLLSSDHLIARQFKKLDVDEDGFLSADDLLQIFDNLSRERVHEIIEEIDLDSDGQINFEEFNRAMQFLPAYVASKSS